MISLIHEFQGVLHSHLVEEGVDVGPAVDPELPCVHDEHPEEELEAAHGPALGGVCSALPAGREGGKHEGG